MKFSIGLHSMCKLRVSVQVGKGEGRLTCYKGALYRSYRAPDEGGQVLL